MTQLKCIKGLVMQPSGYEAFIVGNSYTLYSDTIGEYTIGEIEYVTVIVDGKEEQEICNSKHYLPEPFKSECFNVMS